LTIESRQPSGGGVGIEVRDLQVAYGGTRVLHGVSLDFTPGSFTALLGSSGCGKTTLLRALSGFVPVESGSILLGGQDIARLPPEKRGMAMVFQSYALWPHMSVHQNIGYGLKLRGASRAEIDAKVSSVLSILGLSGYESRKVTALSGGQRQRVALGRALAVDPPVLLLDEPLSNLDAKIRLAMRHELKSLHRRLGLTAIHVTHDQEEAMTMADEIVILDAGRVLQKGSPEAVYRAPVSPFVASFLGADNVISGEARHDGTALSIRLPGGGETRVDATRSVEGECLIHFRANAVHFGTGSAKPGLRLAGRITQSSYPGGVYRYEVDTPAGRFLVDDERRAQPGETIELLIPAEEMHVFPAGTPSA